MDERNEISQDVLPFVFDCWSSYEEDELSTSYDDFEGFSEDEVPVEYLPCWTTEEKKQND